jgi:hypothetical protein
MKKLFILLILIIFSGLFLRAQPVIDSMVVKHCYHNDDNGLYYTWSVDSFSNEHLIYTVVFDTTNLYTLIDYYEYSATNKMTKHSYNTYSSSGFYHHFDSLFTYDSQDTLSGLTIYNYMFGSSYNIIYQHDTVAHVYTKIVQTAPDTVSPFVDFNRTIYRFDSNGNLMNMEIDRQPSWTMTRYDEYYYSSQDTIDYILSGQYGTSMDSILYDYSYNLTGQSKRIINYGWNSLTMAFDDTMEFSAMYYDSLYRVSATSSGFFISNGWWDLYDSTYFIYDDVGRVTIIYAEYYPHAGNWTNYIYDSSTGLIDSLNRCNWGQSSSNCSYCKYEYYALPLGINEKDDNNILIYPVPANDKLNITLPDWNLKSAHVVIRDVLSRVIIDKEYSVDKNISISLPETLNGMYFLTIENSTLHFTAKVICN